MPKILIVEDDPFLLKMYKMNIEKDGWEILIAENGAKGLEQIESEKPDLVLLDLVMPEVDGFSVLEQLKEKGNVIPVIVTSNLSQEIDQQKCRDLGAVDYCIKSNLDLAELQTKIESYLP